MGSNKKQDQKKNPEKQQYEVPLCHQQQVTSTRGVSVPSPCIAINIVEIRRRLFNASCLPNHGSDGKSKLVHAACYYIDGAW